MTANETFGANVKKYRKAQRWSQAQLATYLSTSQVQVSRVEKGYRDPSIVETVALATLLEVSPNDLFGYEEPIGREAALSLARKIVAVLT